VPGRIACRVSRKLLDRLERLPQAVRDVAWKAQLRLCQRYRRLAAAGKPKVVVITAIARAHRLHGFDHRRHRPAGQELLDLTLQAREPRLGILDRVDIILEHDLLRGWSKRTVVSQRR
jgi:hypothetical protein